MDKIDIQKLIENIDKIKQENHKEELKLLDLMPIWDSIKSVLDIEEIGTSIKQNIYVLNINSSLRYRIIENDNSIEFYYAELEYCDDDDVIRFLKHLGKRVNRKVSELKKTKKENEKILELKKILKDYKSKNA